MGEPEPAPPREAAYGLDDLVAHEKRNLRLVLAVFLVAVVWYAVRGRAPTAPPPDARDAVGAPAPVGSSR